MSKMIPLRFIVLGDEPLDDPRRRVARTINVAGLVWLIIGMRHPGTHHRADQLAQLGGVGIQIEGLTTDLLPVLLRVVLENQIDCSLNTL
jgi:hypothetical protein